MKIENGIYLLDGAEPDCNMFCIDNELLVDCGTGFYIEETLQQMENYGINPKKIKHIVITHAHFDHCGAAKKWKKLTGAKVMVHEKDKESLETGENTFAEVFETKYDSAKADKVLEEGDKIETKNFSFRVLHTPGHTPGGISLWDEKNKVLVSGDNIFLDGIGRTDMPGGNEKELKN